MTQTTIEDFIAEEVLPATYTELYEAHRDTALRVARREHKNLPACTVDDVVQSIWEHAGTNLLAYLLKDASTVESYMAKAAKRYCAKERRDYMYFTGTFVYTPKHTRAALESCAWSVLEECPDVEARLDVREAFESLGPAQAAAVFRRYGLKEPLSEFNVTEKRNLYKGIDNITYRLNDGLRKTPRSFDEIEELIGEED